MKERKTYLDFIKVIACLFVVSLHVMIFRIIQTKGQAFSLPYYLYYISIYAIPLFFMCSGYLTLNRSLNWKYIFTKIKNLTLLIVAWCVILFIIHYLIKAPENIIDILVGTIIQKGTASRFWYLSALIILYFISIPLQKQIQKGNGYKLLLYTTLIGTSVMLGSYFVYKPLALEVIQTFRLWTSLFYFVLGGMMPTILASDFMQKFKLKKVKLISLIYILITPFLIYFIAKNNIYNFSAEYQYDVILVKIGAFLIFVLAYFHKFKFPKIWSKLQQLTFGIYVVHSPIFHFLVRKNMKITEIPMYLLAYVVVVILSAVVIKLLLSIKPTRWLVRG